jgi:uncharacterized protein (TIGR00299 family) protein
MGTDAGRDRILYFDAFNGVSGDMILGGLLDLGLPLDHLRRRLAALSLEPYRLTSRKIDRNGLSGTDFRVEIENGRHSHGRTPGQIYGLIERSGLEDPVKEMALSVFRRLARAEAAVHGEAVEHVHFHEVGAVDAIVDIVGACIGFHYFGARRFFSSPLNLGSGTVTFSHGTWPVPAPATAHLVRGYPVVMGEVQAELTTPTGAAIVTTLAAPGAATPAWTLDRWGFGAGDRELPGIPNMLRLVLGCEVGEDQPSPTAAEGVRDEEVLVLEADIDDLDPEAIGYFMETALAEGALDVRCAPQQMKKGRPGHHLSVLCRPQDRDRMMGLLFRETTTLGIRWKPWRRWVLEREFREVETGHGKVRVKVGRFRGEPVTVWPEYEDLKKIAARTRLPLKSLRLMAIREATETE